MAETFLSFECNFSFLLSKKIPYSEKNNPYCLMQHQIEGPQFEPWNPDKEATLCGLPSGFSKTFLHVL